MVRGAALLVAVVFGVGVVKLLLFRFQVGDIYPPYSSLRTDPLGAKALHDSIAGLDGVAVERNYTDYRKIAGRGGTTLMYLGVKSEWWTPPSSQPGVAIDTPGTDPMEQLLEFVRDGGRLVITLHPRTSPASTGHILRLLQEELGFGISAKSADGEKMLTVHAGDGAAGLEATAPWRSVIVFENLDPAWRKVYLREDMPVIVERDFGEGSVVLAGDSYFLSNEAMHTHRRPALLAWLIGGDRVIFDERHLGVAEDPGVATLARQYHLTGMFFVLLAVAGLFVWKNAVSFLPRDAEYAERLGGSAVSGKGSTAGLMNLLRQSVAPIDLLGMCLDQWKRSGGLGGRADPTGREVRVEAVVNEQKRMPRKHRDPVGAYRFICRILLERN